jgi:hypothetical protein
MIQWILTKEHWRKIFVNDSKRSKPALHRRGFADSAQAFVGPDNYERTALRRSITRRPTYLEPIYSDDLHVSTSVRFVPANNEHWRRRGGNRQAFFRRWVRDIVNPTTRCSPTTLRDFE